MFEEIVCLTGQEAGPKSIILAGVHGDETCGIQAFKKILPDLKIEKGEVIFMYGNPRAIEAGVRSTETNLNRMFKDDNLISEDEKKSYEYERAKLLKSHLDQTDALLDIHASRTPESEPFVICEKNSREIVESLPVQLIVSGFDDLEPGGTDYYMNSEGKIGICVECGYFKDPQSNQIAEQSIFSFLKVRGHMASNISVQKEIPHFYIGMDCIYITQTSSFVLSKSFNDFEEVSEGQVIGNDGEKEIRSKKDGVILFARNRDKVGEEAFLLGEKKNSLV